MKKTLLPLLISLAIVTALFNKGCHKEPPAASQPATASAPAGEPAALTTAPALLAPAQAAEKAHEALAIIALSDIKVALAQNDYEAALRLAQQAVREYADTTYGREFGDLAAQAAAALTQQQQALQQQSGAQQQERQERFTQHRDRGLEALGRKDYPAAVAELRQALLEQEDSDTRYAYEEALVHSTQPRIAVADFAVAGDIGIPDPGKSVAEMLLTQFNPDQFRLVDRTRLADLLARQQLTIPQINHSPELLKDRKIPALQYLVVGTIVPVGQGDPGGQVVVRARLVEVASGTVVNFAEVAYSGSDALGQALADLAAMLRMSPQEQQAFVAQRRAEQATMAVQAAQQQAELARQAQQIEAAQRAAWIARQMEAWRARQRQAQLEEAWRRHNDQAQQVLVQVGVLLVRQDYDQAAGMARRGVRDFADTRYGRQFVDMQSQAEQGIIHAGDEQRRREEVGRLRHDGMDSMKNGDYDAAVAAFTRALRIQDSQEIRQLLEQAKGKLEEKNARGLAVADFTLGSDVPTGGGASFSELALSRIGGRYAPLSRKDFEDILRANNLRMADVQADPTVLRGKKLHGLRYVVVGAVTGRDPIKVSVRLVDLQDGKVLSTAQASADQVRDLNQAVLDAAKLLQMSEAERQSYQQNQKQYAQALERGKSAGDNQKWQESYDGYQQAYDLQKTEEARKGMDAAKGKLAEDTARADKAKRALAAARTALDKGNFQAAADQIRAAQAIDPDSSEAKALLERMGPVLLVTAELNGKEVKGASVTVDGAKQAQATPASIRLEAGKSYDVAVTLAPAGKKRYTTARTSVQADPSGVTKFRAVIQEDKTAPTSPPAERVPPAPVPSQAPDAQPSPVTPPAFVPPSASAPAPAALPTPASAPAATPKPAPTAKPKPLPPPPASRNVAKPVPLGEPKVIAPPPPPPAPAPSVPPSPPLAGPVAPSSKPISPAAVTDVGAVRQPAGPIALAAAVDDGATSPAKPIVKFRPGEPSNPRVQDQPGKQAPPLPPPPVRATPASQPSVKGDSGPR